MRVLLALRLAAFACAASCAGVTPPDPAANLGCDPGAKCDEAAPAEEEWADEAPRACCVWIDLDGTLNTFGAWGYPLNPVPAADLCTILDGYGGGVTATALTARDGCWPATQPGERECAGLEPTVSVACASGIAAARAKEEVMRAHDDLCARHVLIDDNRAAGEIQGGDPEIRHVRPTPFDWPGTREAIRAALDGC